MNSASLELPDCMYTQRRTAIPLGRNKGGLTITLLFLYLLIWERNTVPHCYFNYHVPFIHSVVALVHCMLVVHLLICGPLIDHELLKGSETVIQTFASLVLSSCYINVR